VITPDAQTFSLRFTLRQLQYFVAAGETGSITLASERVNISQPSISAAISQLETEFGLQLFVRHHAQGLSLTPAGERFLQAAKSVLQHAMELHGVADEVATVPTGPLHIGSFRTFSPLLIPELCKRFLDQYPGVNLRVTEGNEAELLALLRRAEISLAVTYGLNITDEVDFEPLAELPTYILLATDHPLAKRSSLALAELVEEPFILLDLPLSREYFMSLFLREGVTPKIGARSEYPETVRSYVASGFGYSLMTARPLNKAAVNGKPLAYIRLQGEHMPMVLGIASLKGLRRPRAAEAFEEHCRALICTNNLPGMAAWDD
jgi:DNA-binding transcriptional LysR family regulator